MRERPYTLAIAATRGFTDARLEMLEDLLRRCVDNLAAMDKLAEIVEEWWCKRVASAVIRALPAEDAWHPKRRRFSEESVGFAAGNLEKGRLEDALGSQGVIIDSPLTLEMLDFWREVALSKRA